MSGQVDSRSNEQQKEQFQLNKKEEDIEQKEVDRTQQIIDHSNVDTSMRDKNERSTTDNINSDKLDDQHTLHCELILRSYHSILKNSVSYKERDRVDKHGQQILSITKDHQISFSEQLFEVVIVENWKEYNSIEDDESAEEKLKFIGEPGQTIRLRRRELLLLIILIIAAGVLLGTGRKCFESVNIEGNEGKRIVIKLKNKRPQNYNVSHEEAIKIKKHNHAEQAKQQEQQREESRNNSTEPSRLRKAKIDFKKYSRVFPKDFFGFTKTESDAQENTQLFLDKAESLTGLPEIIETKNANSNNNLLTNIPSFDLLNKKNEKQNKKYEARKRDCSRNITNSYIHRRCKSEADSPLKELRITQKYQINQERGDIDENEINKPSNSMNKRDFQSYLATNQDIYCVQQSEKNTPKFISEGTILNQELINTNSHSVQIKNADLSNQNGIIPKGILLRRSFHEINSLRNKENKIILEPENRRQILRNQSCHKQSKSEININSSTSLILSSHDKPKTEANQQPVIKVRGKETKLNPFLSRIESAKQFTLFNLVRQQQDEICWEQLNYRKQSHEQIELCQKQLNDQDSLSQVAIEGKENQVFFQDKQLQSEHSTQTLRNALSFQRNENISKYQLTRCQTERSQREERLGEQKHSNTIKQQKDKYALSTLTSRIETVPCFNGYDQKGNHQKKNQIITKISSKLQCKSEKKLQAKGSVSSENMNRPESSQNYSKVQSKVNNQTLNKVIVWKRERCLTSEAQINRTDSSCNEFIEDTNFPIIKLIKRQRLKRRVSETGKGILEDKYQAVIPKNVILSNLVDPPLVSKPSNRKLESSLKSLNTSEQLEFSFKNTGQWQGFERIESKLYSLKEKDISHQVSVISDGSSKTILNSKQCYFPSPVSNIKNQPKKQVYPTKLSSCALRASAQK